MNKHKVNFMCPVETVKVIDDLAEADHRDRTSMLNRMIDFYISHPTNKEAVAKANGKPQRKAGAR